MPIALVTGASRGIGCATAVALARRGFDVAVCGRTMHEGDGRDDGDHAKGSRTIGGSLDRTADLVEAAGSRALALRFDMVSAQAVEDAVATVASTWGAIDVVVNNAVYHRGNNVEVTDLDAALITDNLLANAGHPLLLIARVLPSMVERGGGRIINITSGAGERDPDAPALRGGWGALYGMSKAALARVAGIVAVEAGPRGVLCFGLDPGFVKTAVVGNLPGFEDLTGTPEEVPAAAITWLATAPEASAFNGQTVVASELAAEYDLYPVADVLDGPG
jgi:NAD(P)-dependent dehydrogenase (short-subunit alcohol dehydrogenase family)